MPRDTAAAPVAEYRGLRPLVVTVNRVNGITRAARRLTNSRQNISDGHMRTESNEEYTSVAAAT